MGTVPCPAHRELLWQEPALSGSPISGGTRCPHAPVTPRLGGREEAEQRKEPVAGDGGCGLGL